MPRRDSIDVKVVDDVYDMLHLIEMGHGTLQDLSEVLGLDGNKPESNYRQVERVKHRAIKAGIKVEFDDTTMRFTCEKNAKFKYLKSVLPKMLKSQRTVTYLGFYVDKHEKKANKGTE